MAHNGCLAERRNYGNVCAPRMTIPCGLFFLSLRRRVLPRPDRKSPASSTSSARHRRARNAQARFAPSLCNRPAPSAPAKRYIIRLGHHRQLGSRSAKPLRKLRRRQQKPSLCRCINAAPHPASCPRAAMPESRQSSISVSFCVVSPQRAAHIVMVKRTTYAPGIGQHRSTPATDSSSPCAYARYDGYRDIGLEPTLAHPQADNAFSPYARQNDGDSDLRCFASAAPHARRKRRQHGRHAPSTGQTRPWRAPRSACCPANTLAIAKPAKSMSSQHAAHQPISWRCIWSAMPYLDTPCPQMKLTGKHRRINNSCAASTGKRPRGSALPRPFPIG